MFVLILFILPLLALDIELRNYDKLVTTIDITDRVV